MGRKSQLSNKIAELKEEEHHENPLLKLLQITKKEKQLNKSKDFNTKLQQKVTFNISGGISKSSARRQKRKAKQELKPKMDDLLLALESTTTTTTTTSTTPEYVKPSKKQLNLPNANKQSGHAKIMKNEYKNFNKLLLDNSFRASPFAALKDTIRHNLN